ncbi:MAG: hypothetical protein J5905_00815 [Prevotella sp.]|nr:hypothetical protein [Prevotella sp.]
MKIVKAVAPYVYPGGINFKHKPYEAWVRLEGQVAPANYPPRWLHGLAFRYEIPTWGGSIVQKFRSSKVLRTMLSNGQNSEQILNFHREARLRFVEPVSLYFDTFPDYALYEVIPFVWDCWPCYEEKMCKWLERHDVRTAIFTSAQTAERMREQFPQMNIMWCAEAVDGSLYTEGKPLAERGIDLMEFGRSNERAFNVKLPETVKHVSTMQDGKFLYTNEQLYQAMGDAKVTITLPRSVTQPEIAGDIETLTQRYWECMLSRMVMLGHAPKELVDLIGYNPVIELDTTNAIDQLNDILTHIEDYQSLVDKNRETAIRMGDWTVRIREVMKWLKGCGYET